MTDIETRREYVKTPIPANKDGSGHDTEENVRTEYESGDHLVTRSKITDRGWSVWYYTLDPEPEIEERVGSKLNGQESARLARRTIEEVSE